MAKESIMRIVEAERLADEAEARAKAESKDIMQAAEDEAKKIVGDAKAEAMRLISSRVEEAKTAAAAIEKDAASDARAGAALLAKNGGGRRVVIRAIDESFVPNGDRESLLARFRLDARSVEAELRSVLGATGGEEA